MNSMIRFKFIRNYNCEIDFFKIGFEDDVCWDNDLFFYY